MKQSTRIEENNQRHDTVKQMIELYKKTSTVYEVRLTYNLPVEGTIVHQQYRMNRDDAGVLFSTGKEIDGEWQSAKSPSFLFKEKARETCRELIRAGFNLTIVSIDGFLEKKGNDLVTLYTGRWNEIT